MRLYMLVIIPEGKLERVNHEALKHTIHSEAGHLHTPAAAARRLSPLLKRLHVLILHPVTVIVVMFYVSLVYNFKGFEYLKKGTVKIVLNVTMKSIKSYISIISGILKTNF